MKLRAWLTEESLRLAAFQAWWKLQQQQQHPHQYPDELDASLWDEAFQTFDPSWIEPKPDEDGDCTHCGLPFEDPAAVTHECPPGFARPDPGPKFRIGQRVQLKNWNVKGTIEGYAYKLERQGYADESSIEPVEQKS